MSKSSESSEVGLALARARKALGLSNSVLAEHLGMSRQLLTDIERGKRELLERWIERLPPALRIAVVPAAIDEHHRAIARLRQIRDGRGDG